MWWMAHRSAEPDSGPASLGSEVDLDPIDADDLGAYEDAMEATEDLLEDVFDDWDDDFEVGDDFDDFFDV